MKVVLQRVSNANVSISNRITGKIGHGFVILLGIENDDTQEDIAWLVKKILSMRVFADEEGKMNRSIMDVDGDCLVVSQFTLHASTRKGNRPSFIKAARPELAIPLYEQFIALMESAMGRFVATGEFGGDMQVALINDGPVTITMDSKIKE